MQVRKFFIAFLAFCCLGCLAVFFFVERPSCVTVKLQGQFGNQLFQIATAYAYSLDHRCELVIPQLALDNTDNIASNAKRLFLSKISHHPLSVEPVVWRERYFHRYAPIPAKSSLQLDGYFQNEKYFKHRREEIIKLLAPPQAMLQEILVKYPFFKTDAMTVGVQIRDYRKEFPTGEYHPTHGREYYAKAFASFPEDALFLISSNNLEFAKACTEGLGRNLIYLDEQDYLKEFYMLTLCKSFIISNSSFGWWSAWLSNASNKKVVVPSPWFTPPYRPNKSRELIPAGAVVIESVPIAIE